MGVAESSSENMSTCCVGMGVSVRGRWMDGPGTRNFSMVWGGFGRHPSRAGACGMGPAYWGGGWDTTSDESST